MNVHHKPRYLYDLDMIGNYENLHAPQVIHKYRILSDIKINV